MLGVQDLKFVKEAATFHDIVVKESKADPVFNEPYIRGKAIYLELEVPGANGRAYPGKLIEQAHQMWKPLMEKKGWFGEMDHPFGDDIQRDVTISLKDASHVTLNVTVNNKYVEADFETTPNVRGIELARMINRGYGIGFSLRGVGRMQKSTEGDYYVATEPFFVITYDSVANPSFKKALVKSVTVEALVSVARAAKESGSYCLLCDFFDKANKEISNIWDIQTAKEAMCQIQGVVALPTKLMVSHLEKILETYIIEPFEKY